MRDFSSIRRVVVKIGTNTLTSKQGGVDQSYLQDLAHQVQELRDQRKEVMIVSSGAIGVGTRAMGQHSRVKKVQYRQAYAAIGQPLLMAQYQGAFNPLNIPLAQVLVTRDIFNNRDSYLNVRNAVETLLSLGVVPVFNENDSVSTSEIGPVFGDNDQLSAHIASKLDADLLIILSDIDGLYTGHPQTDPQAKRLDLVEQLTPEIFAMAQGAGSEFSTGGMVTKLKAVEIASRSGCKVLLAHGRESNCLPRLIAGETLGTLFLAGERLSGRRRWIINAQPKGTILVDQGALDALNNNKSLLPSGITGVEGEFKAGNVVLINEDFKAVTNLSSAELEKLKGLHSRVIQELLGADRRDDVARPEDVVPL
ncbi:MAG: glutamate 5-kinase [Spirochaetaceae bacterium]|jgi:glutamate 5-kinase|nr:glutamate 5-kinase [Spirochaetaceae bacterium]